MAAKMSSSTIRTVLVILGLAATCVTPGRALEPPTREQLEQYRRDGTLTERIAAAYKIGNHRMAQDLVYDHAQRYGVAKAVPKGTTKRLPSTGTQRVFTLLIDFADTPSVTDAAVIDSQMYGDGLEEEYPLESLRNFYLRASHGTLEILGATLGWYTTAYDRSEVVQTRAGREALIMEVIDHFDAAGHDFSQYDNDGDGVAENFLVIWSGQHGPWADFWWGYQTWFDWNDNLSYRVDGVQLGSYSWQWETYDYPLGFFTPYVTIHETGHALGLPDYYDYDDTVGPRGGVGGLDQMDGNWGDHNCFSKWMLGWITPEIYNQGTTEITLGPSDATTDAVVLMHGDAPVDPFSEYFMVQYRRRQGNDATYPNDGLLIWHVDARTDEGGYTLYDNSYTEHKMLRLMEADGLEQISRAQRADAGDYYQPGQSFGPQTFPSSDRHDGSPTNLLVDAISMADESMGLSASLGSGCAVYCDAEVTDRVWPGLPTHFATTTDRANCSDGAISLLWDFGDGSSSTGAAAVHTFAEPGTYQWSLRGDLGDASCARQGSMLVCNDMRCWSWMESEAMAGARAGHAAVTLTDGRVLMVGGGAPPEIYDPVIRDWTPTGTIAGVYNPAAGVLLEDGRVLVVGSALGDSVNAEIYDPATDTWSLTAQMIHHRSAHSATRLGDGRVLVAGGHYSMGGPGDTYDVLTAELFDPVTETWTEAGSIGEGMETPGLTTLMDGRAVLTGNWTGMIFDPVTQTWEEMPELLFEQRYHFSELLPDGRVVIAGGINRQVLIYDPRNEQFRWNGTMPTERRWATAAVLPSGRLLITGGQPGRRDEPIATAVVYDPAMLSFMPLAPMTERRKGHTTTLLGDGSVLVAGGRSVRDEASPPSSSVDRFEVPRMPPRRGGTRRP